METLFADIRYGVRQLRKTPTFTIIAVLTLAIGIGANTVIFSQVNAVLLKMLPVRNPEQLQQLEWTSKDRAFANSISSSTNRRLGGKEISEYFSYPVYLGMRDGGTSFSDLLCYADAGVNLGVGNRAERGTAQLVSGNYFRGLGTEAILGRTIVPEDDQAGAGTSVVVLSYGFWQRAFGGNPGILNQTITINANPFVIIGVLPREFYGVDPGYSPDIMVPVSTYPVVNAAPDALKSQTNWSVCRIIGRLRDDVSPEAARAEAEGLARQTIAANPPNRAYDPPNLSFFPMDHGVEGLRNDSRSSLLLLMTVVGVILLVACANVAGLLLARATARRREVATRLAVGAPRARLIRQLLTESLLLSLLGGALGIGFAYTMNRLVPTPVTSRISAVGVDIAPDVRVLAFSVALSVLTGIIFGLAPALRATRVDLLSMLKQASSSSGEARFRFTGGKALVTLQVALSLLLLIAAGLFIRTLVNLRSIPLGFDPEGVLVFRVNPALNGYTGTRLLDFYENGVKRLESTPGVISASMSQVSVFSGSTNGTSIALPDLPQESRSVSVNVHNVAPRFFETWKIPILLGRDVQWSDKEGAPQVILINDTFARKHFPNSNPVGQVIGSKRDTTIIGVVADSKYAHMREDAKPTMYVPFRQRSPRMATFVLRTAGDPASLSPTVRRIMNEFDPNLPIFDVMTQQEQVSRRVQQERLLTNLLVLFGGIALLLCCLGIYGMLAYSVSRKTSEIGLRMALGAQRPAVVRMVVRESLIPVAIGIVVGLGAAFPLTRLVQGMLYGITPNDPLTIVAAAAVFIVIAAAAAFLPARRASRIDPLKALRYE